MKIVPGDRWNEFVLTALLDDIHEGWQRIEFLDFARSDGDLKLHIERRIVWQRGDLFADCGRDFAVISSRAHAPCAICRIGMRERLEVKCRIEGTAPDAGPKRVQARLSRDRLVESEGFELAA